MGGDIGDGSFWHFLVPKRTVPFVTFLYVYIYNKSINNCQNVWMFLQDVIYLQWKPDKTTRYEKTDR